MSGLDAIDGILEHAGDPDEVLRETVRVLASEPDATWAGIAFLERGELTLGPSFGRPDETRRHRVPIVYQDERVGELWVDGEPDPVFLARVADVISTHVLIGWDTGGEAWEP